MKKLLLISALSLGAISINAQNFTVTVEGNPVKNGETVTSNHIKAEVVTDNLGTYTKYQLDPEVMVTAEADMKASVSVTNTSSIDIPGMEVCWPISCIPVPKGTSATTPQDTFLAGVPTDLLIESTVLYDDVPADIALLQSEFTLTCTVKIIPTANPSNTFTFNLNIVNDPRIIAGVDAVVDENAPVEYFDLAGRKVINPEKGQVVIERKGAKVTKRIF